MPVALPPPALPQVIPVAEVQRHGSASQRYAFGHHTVHLVAFDGFDRRTLDFLVANAADAEKLVLALAHLAYSSGDLSAQVLYSVSGQNLYIMLVRRPIRRVTGDVEVKRFFEGAPHGANFDFSSFERGRVLASGYADRAGIRVLPRFTQGPGNWVDLELRTEADPEADRFTVRAEASNQGNRFAGRNLIALGMTGSTSGGLEAGVQFRTSPSGANDERAATEYVEGSVQLSQITTAGVFGVNAKRIQFTMEMPFGIEGWYQEAGAEWSGVLGAGIASRSLLRTRLSYSDRASERSQDSLDLFHERYGALELNPSFSYRGSSQRLDASLSLVGGQSISTHQTTAEDAYQLARPMLRYGWQMAENWSFSLAAAGQWSGQVLPEYQQWTLGGMGLMPAYLPATFFGDSGHYVRVGEEFKVNAGQWTTSIEIFGEQASVQSDDPQRPGARNVSDAGVALGLSWRRNVELKVLAARPVGSEKIADDQRANFYASLSLSF